MKLLLKSFIPNHPADVLSLVMTIGFFVLPFVTSINMILMFILGSLLLALYIACAIANYTYLLTLQRLAEEDERRYNQLTDYEARVMRQ